MLETVGSSPSMVVSAGGGGESEIYDHGERKVSNKEILVVGSKVKNYLRDQNVKTSGDLVEAVSNHVYEMLDRAVTRAKENKRSTVRPYDL